MGCKQVTLNSSNCFSVDSGYDYSFNVKASTDITDKVVHFKIKSVNEDGFILELTNSSDPNVSGIYINNESTGDFDVIIKASDSQGINGNKVYECYLQGVSTKELLFQGSIMFDEGVIHE